MYIYTHIHRCVYISPKKPVYTPIFTINRKPLCNPIYHAGNLGTDHGLQRPLPRICCPCQTQALHGFCGWPFFTLRTLLTQTAREISGKCSRSKHSLGNLVNTDFGEAKQAFACAANCYEGRQLRLKLIPDPLKDPKNGPPPPNMNPLLHWGN